MPDDPVVFVVERSARGEFPSLFRGRLPEYLTTKGSTRLVCAWRLDTLPSGAALAAMPLGDLYDQCKRLRDEGGLPPSNLADPPRQTEGQKGVQRGEASWWRPKPLPRPEGWSKAMDRARRPSWAQRAPITVGFNC